MKKTLKIFLILTLLLIENIYSQSTKNRLLSKNNDRKLILTFSDTDSATYKECEKLYRSKKYKEALEKTESLLNKYKNEKLFYLYGEILLSLKRFDEAQESFQISSNMHSNRPELSIYNIACILSIQNKLPESLDYLERAIDRGYNNFSHIQNDPDLENLRKSELWKTKKEYLKSRIMNFTNEKLIGKLSFSGFGTGDINLLCNNGRIVNSDECNNLTTKKIHFGTWRVEANSIHIQYQLLCTSKGYGKVIDTSECGNKYEKYDKIVCDPIERKRIIPRYELAITFGRTYKGMDPAEQDFAFQHKKFKENPKHCDQDFIPTNFDEFDISKY